jgi:hypothetical protein
MAPTFSSWALEGGEWSASRPRHFTTGKRTEWAPEPVWAPWSTENSLSLAVQPVTYRET